MEDTGRAPGQQGEAPARPLSTYRLQLNRGFTFGDTAKIVSYLHGLGITHVYASPVMKSRPGSQHGYDVTDHNELNPELGGAEGFRLLVNALKEHGMGLIVDFVPNHMGASGNAWWQGVLEDGRASKYAAYFDIDWEPPQPALRNKVLLPVLEDRYGSVLSDGKLRLVFSDGAFFITYGTLTFPVDPKSTLRVLSPSLDRLRRRLGEGHPDSRELAGIIEVLRDLPDEVVPRRGEAKAQAKDLMARLYRRSREIKEALDAALDRFNCGAYQELDALLEAQNYRLGYWRAAADELNYRRFFEITDLVGLRVELPGVFEESHRLLRRLLAEGSVEGVRIDHIDGLYDPAAYLVRLREIGALFVVVEKILGYDERLPAGWAAEGTTGYEYGAALNGIFVDSRNGRALRRIYRDFTGVKEDFGDIAYRGKKLVMGGTMFAEINGLAHRLAQIAGSSRLARDFTLRELRAALAEFIACLPVYRTYINAPPGVISKEDRAVIEAAFAAALRRNPGMADVFDLLCSLLLLRYPPDTDEAGQRLLQSFVMRLQQTTGAVMAKGVEDTAFYVYNPLPSLNEVGGFPDHMGISLDEFHRRSRERQERHPYSLIATYTHDSKRSEDVRARINVLSEVPGEWRAALARWRRLNRNKKSILGGKPAPDGNEEYFLYQTLLGTCPAGEMTPPERDEYRERISAYLTKALREAKVHTSWVDPDPVYEKAVLDFTAAVLDPALSGDFLADFMKLNRAVARCGMFSSLSQVVIKLFSPGIPDTYRGSELWDYSLVDPDNRRPVDFRKRAELLAELERVYARDAGALAARLLADMPSGAIKQFVLWRSLLFRRQHPRLFLEGEYIPLKAAGERKNNVFAFARRFGDEMVIVVAPRLLAGLTRLGEHPPLGEGAWGDTRLRLPAPLRFAASRDIFTGKTLAGGASGLALADILSSFPAAALAVS